MKVSVNTLTDTEIFWNNEYKWVISEHDFPGVINLKLYILNVAYCTYISIIWPLTIKSWCIQDYYSVECVIGILSR